MLFLYLLIFCSLLFGLSVKRSGFFKDFLDKKQTDAVKGVFIWMVFISHIQQEIIKSGCHFVRFVDCAGDRIGSEFGQLIVVMFLFYSGYGVMESMKGKGRVYLDSFPRRRLLTTILNFDVAVLCFIVMNLLMGIQQDFRLIGWSLIGWKSVGNSNWYIFVILYCYFVSWISGKYLSGSVIKVAVMTTFLVLIGEVALSVLKQGQHWWYDTILCYPVGMCFSCFKDAITSFLKRFYLPVFGLLLAMFLFLHFQSRIPSFGGLTYNLKGIAFAFLIVLTTMKVKTGNRFLYWSGLSVFPIFIYQRLPMLAFRHWIGDSWVCENPYLYVLLVSVCTGCIAYCYKYWQIKFQ